MKPPPGPMISLGPADRPRRTRPKPVTAVGRAAPRGPSRAAALGLAVALMLGGAVVLAPYAGGPAPSPTPATSVIP